MVEKSDFAYIRRQVYLYYVEDGLADIGIGLVILGFGLLLLLELPALVGLMGLPAFAVWYAGKRKLVVPRVGSIQPGRALKMRFQGFFINLTLIGIGFLFLFITGTKVLGIDFTNYSLIIFGLVIGAGISSLGFLLDTVRFYIYGTLVFLAMAGGDVLSRFVRGFDPFLIAVISAGGLITLAGIILLVRFLYKYPVITLGNTDD